MICKNTRKPDLTECLLGFDLYLANGESPVVKTIICRWVKDFIAKTNYPNEKFVSLG